MEERHKTPQEPQGWFVRLCRTFCKFLGWSCKEKKHSDLQKTSQSSTVEGVTDVIEAVKPASKKNAQHSQAKKHTTKT